MTDCCSREGLELMGAIMARAAASRCKFRDTLSGCAECMTRANCSQKANLAACEVRVDRARQAVHVACGRW